MNKQQLDPLSILVHDSILVSETLVIRLIVTRITTWKVKADGLVVSVAEYRKMLGDYKSTDERIVERLRYLEAFCRNIIKPELKTYANKQQNPRR